MDKRVQLEQIFDEQFEPVYRFFYAKTLSKETAEDLTSETFIGLAKALQAGAEIEDMQDYLYGIARFTFYNYLRKKYRDNEISLDSIPEIAEEVERVSGPNFSLEEVLLKLLIHIPEKQAVILRLRLIEKMPLTEISIYLKKDMNYVKTTQRRALISIKKVIACTPLPTNS